MANNDNALAEASSINRHAKNPDLARLLEQGGSAKLDGLRFLADDLAVGRHRGDIRSRLHEYYEYWWVCLRCLLERAIEDKNNKRDGLDEFNVMKPSLPELADPRKLEKTDGIAPNDPIFTHLALFRRLYRDERTLSRIELVAESVCELLIRLRNVLQIISPEKDLHPYLLMWEGPRVPTTISSEKITPDNAVWIYVEFSNFVSGNDLHYYKCSDSPIYVVAKEEEAYRSFGWWNTSFLNVSQDGTETTVKQRYTYNPEFVRRFPDRYESNAKVSYFSYPAFYAYSDASLAQISWRTATEVKEYINGEEGREAFGNAILTNILHVAGRENLYQLYEGTLVPYLQDIKEVLSRESATNFDLALTLSYGMSMYGTKEIEQLLDNPNVRTLSEAFGLFWLLLVKVPTWISTEDPSRQGDMLRKITQILSSNSSWFEYPALQDLASEKTRELERERAELARAKQMLDVIHQPVQEVIDQLMKARQQIVSVSSALSDPKRSLFAVVPDIAELFEQDQPIPTPKGSLVVADHGLTYRLVDEYRWVFAHALAKVRGHQLKDDSEHWKQLKPEQALAIECSLFDHFLADENNQFHQLAKALRFACVGPRKQKYELLEFGKDEFKTTFRSLFFTDITACEDLLRRFKRSILDIHKPTLSHLSLRQLLVALPGITAVHYPATQWEEIDLDDIVLLNADENPFPTLGQLIDFLAGIVHQADPNGKDAAIHIKDVRTWKDGRTSRASMLAHSWEIKTAKKDVLSIDTLKSDKRTQELLRSWLHCHQQERNSAIFQMRGQYLGNFLGPIQKGLQRTSMSFAPQPGDVDRIPKELVLRWRRDDLADELMISLAKSVSINVIPQHSLSEVTEALTIEGGSGSLARSLSPSTPTVLPAGDESSSTPTPSVYCLDHDSTRWLAEIATEIHASFVNDLEDVNGNAFVLVHANGYPGHRHGWYGRIVALEALIRARPRVFFLFVSSDLAFPDGVRALEKNCDNVAYITRPFPHLNVYPLSFQSLCEYEYKFTSGQDLHTAIEHWRCGVSPKRIFVTNFEEVKTAIKCLNNDVQGAKSLLRAWVQKYIKDESLRMRADLIIDAVAPGSEESVFGMIRKWKDGLGQQ